MSDLFRLYDQAELGADGYPPEWHATLKHEVRAAAGHRCIRCLHPYRNGEHGTGEWSPCDERCRHFHGGVVRVTRDGALLGRYEDYNGGLDIARAGWEDDQSTVIEAAWRILTVHHLDGNKANCRWWNLAALCQRCHLEIQGRVRMERRWPHEHTDWFKPYVAGFYAWSFLKQDLTRVEVEARLDELLALEDRQLALSPCLEVS